MSARAATEDKRRVPELRFPEFDGEWEETRLGQLGTFKNGFNADKSAFGSGTPFVNLMDVFGRTSVGSNQYGRVKATSKEIESYSLRYGDVLFVRSSVKRSGVGQASLVDARLIDTIFSGFLIRFRERSNDLYHFYKSLAFNSRSFRKEILARATSSANTNINQESLETLKVQYPSLPEQKKIAAFLGAVDGKLRALREREAALTQFKRGLMQQLFSQSRRFTRDDGSPYPEWEEKQLGDVAEFSSGGTPSKEIREYWGGSIPWISAASMHYDVISASEERVTELGQKNGTRTARAGTLLLLVRGSMLYNRIPAGICTLDVTYNQDVKALVATPKTTEHFLLSYIRAHEHSLLSLVVGTGIGAGKLDTGTLKSLKLSLPHPEEQQKIADALSAIDTKITAVSDKIAEVETFKRGLLQKMFV